MFSIANPRLPSRMPQFLIAPCFVAAYVLLDWASYLHPLHGLNITPWNPSLALGLVYWFHVGKKAALPWFVGILISEVLVRSLPATLPATLALSGVLTLGYGGIAKALRHHGTGPALKDQRHLLIWLAIVLIGTLLTSAAFIAILLFLRLIPGDDWSIALARFWIGDCVGIIVTMPFFWLLFDDRQRLKNLALRWETAAYVALAIIFLFVSFGLGGSGEFQYFYLLFPPLVWAAARQGVAGAAIAAFALQAGIIVAVQWQNLVAVTVFELQLLGAVIAFVGLFIGTVVDEKQRISNDLRQSLRLAAAGEMAGALAHEINQPLTALSAYGSACESLLDSGETGERLRDTIRRLVTEAQRAGDVVRRLRDFFRTGTTQLEHIELDALLESVARQFLARSREQSIQIVVEPPLARIQLFIDRLQMEIVLRNLVANACDAVANLEPAGRIVTIRSNIKGQKRVDILVEDSGNGISTAAAARLFEPFQSTKSSGLGLGLVISRAIVQAHGGNLTVEVGQHGIFKLTLPIESHLDDDR